MPAGAVHNGGARSKGPHRRSCPDRRRTALVACAPRRNEGGDHARRPGEEGEERVHTRAGRLEEASLACWPQGINSVLFATARLNAPVESAARACSGLCGNSRRPTRLRPCCKACLSLQASCVLLQSWVSDMHYVRLIAVCTTLHHKTRHEAKSQDFGGWHPRSSIQLATYRSMAFWGFGSKTHGVTPHPLCRKALPLPP